MAAANFEVNQILPPWPPEEVDEPSSGPEFGPRPERVRALHPSLLACLPSGTTGRCVTGMAGRGGAGRRGGAGTSVGGLCEGRGQLSPLGLFLY